MFRPYNIRIKRWEACYKVPKNKLDIVFLGSSHSYTTYYPEMIDSSLKINSFNMASNSQQIDQLYFNLKEILKYQKPNIIFIELFSLAGNSRDNKGNWFVYDNLDGQKISLNKLDAILNYRKKEDRRNSLFPLIRNHNDWKKIEVIEKTLSEFKKDEKSRKNFREFERVQSESGEEVKNKYITEKKSDYSNFKISDFNATYNNFHTKPANVSYNYNFNGAENDGYYWIDDYDYGSKIEFIPPEPKRKGYTFGGWYKEPECKNKWNFETDVLPEKRTETNEDGKEEVIYQETRLYAKWL